MGTSDSKQQQQQEQHTTSPSHSLETANGKYRDTSGVFNNEDNNQQSPNKVETIQVGSATGGGGNDGDIQNTTTTSGTDNTNKKDKNEVNIQQQQHQQQQAERRRSSPQKPDLEHAFDARDFDKNKDFVEALRSGSPTNANFPRRTSFTGAGGVGAEGSDVPSTTGGSGGAGGGGGSGSNLSFEALAMHTGTLSRQLRDASSSLRALLRNAARELTREELRALRDLYESLPHDLLENDEQERSRNNVLKMWQEAISAKEFADRFFLEFEKLSAGMQGALFASTDLRQQSRALLGMLTQAMRLLNDHTALQQLMRTLGAKHGLYGVDQKHFSFMNSALIRSLQQSLKQRFTPELQIEWNRVYSMLATAMIQATKEHYQNISLANTFKVQAVQMYLKNFARFVSRAITYLKRAKVHAVKQQKQLERSSAPTNTKTSDGKQQQQSTSPTTGTTTTTGGDDFLLVAEAWLNHSRPQHYEQQQQQKQQEGDNNTNNSDTNTINNNKAIQSVKQCAEEQLARFLSDLVESAASTSTAETVARLSASLAPAILMWVRVVYGGEVPDWAIVKCLCGGFTHLFNSVAAPDSKLPPPNSTPHPSATATAGAGTGNDTANAAHGAELYQRNRSDSAGAGATTGTPAPATQFSDHSVAWVETHLNRGLLSGLQHVVGKHKFAPMVGPFGALCYKIEERDRLAQRNQKAMLARMDEINLIIRHCLLLNRCYQVVSEKGEELIISASIQSLFSFALMVQSNLQALPEGPPLVTTGIEFRGVGRSFRQDLPRIAIAVSWCEDASPVPTENIASPFNYAGVSVLALVESVKKIAGGQIVATGTALRRLEVEKEIRKSGKKLVDLAILCGVNSVVTAPIPSFVPLTSTSSKSAGSSAGASVLLNASSNSSTASDPFDAFAERFSATAVEIDGAYSSNEGLLRGSGGGGSGGSKDMSGSGSGSGSKNVGGDSATVSPLIGKGATSQMPGSERSGGSINTNTTSSNSKKSRRDAALYNVQLNDFSDRKFLSLAELQCDNIANEAFED